MNRKTESARNFRFATPSFASYASAARETIGEGLERYKQSTQVNSFEINPASQRNGFTSARISS